MSEDGIEKIIQWEVKNRIGSVEKSSSSVKKIELYVVYGTSIFLILGPITLLIGVY